MKVAANGGINLSILDGWWVEGYDQSNGWAIGAGEEYTDLAYQDDVESRAIYELLEQEIVPLFYSRSSDGLPRGWIKMMKRSIGTLCPVFNTNRMVQEYMERCYAPAHWRFGSLAADHLKKAAILAQWRRNLTRGWPNVRVEAVDGGSADPVHVGSSLPIKARVNLGSLSADDIEVQLFHGLVDSFGEIPSPRTTPMSHNGPPARPGEPWVFTGSIPCRSSGQHGYAVRIVPKHPDLASAFEPGLICWG
jgi:starch phosphorylase